MDDDNSFFQPENCTIDCSLHITEGRLKNTDCVIFFFLSFLGGCGEGVSEPHLPG